ncbi:MAG: DedA family protein [Chloroflexi bacterium]|nr:MAG: DedA family protein [Chloroflexota bacterium]
MRTVDVPVAVRRLLNSLRSGRPLQVGAVALIVLAAAIVLALLYGDLPEFVHAGGRQLREFMRQNAFLPGFALLYIEESGVPLPAPGDVFVMYVGTRVPHHLAAWILAWLGLILAVVLGATNLFLISRRFGRRLVNSQFAEYIHLSPERLAKADEWFKRYGVLAIIFGRHIPGFRIPITVASGIFEVRYPVFAASVAVSTAIWAGVVLIIGINFGPRLENLLRAHTQLYFVWGAIVVALVLSIFVRQRLRQARAAHAARTARAETKVDRPVESPSSSKPS